MIFYEKVFSFAIDNTNHGTFNGVSTYLSNFDSLVDVDISTQTQDFHQHLSNQNHVIDPLSISFTKFVPHNDTLPITVGSIRFSTRLKKPPSYLFDYHYGNISSHSTSTHSTTPYPLQSILSYSKCSTNHILFACLYLLILSLIPSKRPTSLIAGKKL